MNIGYSKAQIDDATRIMSGSDGEILIGKSFRHKANVIKLLRICGMKDKAIEKCLSERNTTVVRI